MSDDARTDQVSLLSYTFATWVFELHVGGVTPDDAELADACRAVAEASDPEHGERAGTALVERVQALLDGDAAESVASVARRLYGERVADDMGAGDRGARNQRVRKYQFSRGLPWLARIWERTDGSVHPSWLLVERVTDEVAAMDPNPWNDVDEERRLPVSDFHVLWELDGCPSVYIS